MKDLFWADQIANQVIDRAKKEGKIATCRSGASTSGAKHIGNLFDVMKSYIVYKAIRKKNFPARFVLTHDDRDPLRTIPPKLPTLDAKWVSTKNIEKKFSKYLGHPYTNVPCPFDCHYSWAKHFAEVWENGIFAMCDESEIKVFSNDLLYKEGKFEPYIILALKNIETSRNVIQRFQRTKRVDYIPFDAICEECGKITTRAVDFDLENKTIEYECVLKRLAGKYVVKGCGHKGIAKFSDGKLPWSFEWPAQLAIFETQFEPFGKEHAEGSWPRCSAIMREVYKLKPPIPHVYEFLLINGEKMSSRRGNVLIAQEILEIIEPEIFSYFYTKRSLKQRNLDIKNIFHLVDDFEHAERVYYGIEEEKNEHKKNNLIRMYESSWQPKKLPIRIPYRFAAVISQIAPNFETALKMLRATGHIKELSEEEEEQVRTRLNLAKNWVDRFNPEMKIKINDKLPDEIKMKLTKNQKNALRNLADELKTQITQEELYAKLYEIARKHNLKSDEFFSAVYRVLISRESGPRLAPFIIALGTQRVRRILEQI